MFAVVSVMCVRSVRDLHRQVMALSLKHFLPLSRDNRSWQERKAEAAREKRRKRENGEGVRVPAFFVNRFSVGSCFFSLGRPGKHAIATLQRLPELLRFQCHANSHSAHVLYTPVKNLRVSSMVTIPK
eukprot:RCo036407